MKGEKIEVNKNQIAILIVEFVSSILIEKHFFQNQTIPITNLIYIANDVIKTVQKKQTEKFNLSKEFSILYKEIFGKQLTEDEKRYNSTFHKIDPMEEIVNGIKYAMGGSLVKNFFSTVFSSISNGLYSHIPSILGYTGMSYFGPLVISKAIEKILNKFDLPEDQKKVLTPWLTSIARLAVLSITPKVFSTDEEIIYQYPSDKGRFEIYGTNGKTQIYGDQYLIETSIRNIKTPEGDEYPAKDIFSSIKLDGIHAISEHIVEISVINKYGKTIPVRFIKKDDGQNPVLTVESPDKELELEWSNYFFNINTVGNNNSKPNIILPIEEKHRIVQNDDTNLLNITTFKDPSNLITLSALKRKILKDKPLFWSKNLPISCKKVFSNSDTEVHVYGIYVIKTLGDVMGSWKIAEGLHEVGYKVVFYIGMQTTTKDEENYLFHFVNSTLKGKGIEIRIFHVHDPEGFKRAIESSKGKPSFLFEYDNNGVLANLVKNDGCVFHLKTYNRIEIPSHSSIPSLTIHDPNSVDQTQEDLPPLIPFTHEKIGQISTGIGRNSLGLFPANSFSPHAFDDVIKNKISPNELLFGGYLNKNEDFIWEIQKTAMPDAIKIYILSCLAISQKHYGIQNHGKVSLVMNVVIKIIKEKEKPLEPEKINGQITRTLTEEELKKHGVTKVTVFGKKEAITYDLSNSTETGIHLKFFNPFPLSNEQLLAFLHRINNQPYPYLALTMGTLTFGDVLQFENILIFKQVMMWELSFWKAYQEAFQQSPLSEYLKFFDGTKVFNQLNDYVAWIAEMVSKKENRIELTNVHKTIMENTASILDTIKACLEHLKAIGMQSSNLENGNSSQKNQTNDYIGIAQMVSKKENRIDLTNTHKPIMENTTLILDTIKIHLERLKTIDMQSSNFGDSNNGQKNQINLINERKKVLIEITLLLKTIKESQLDPGTKSEMMIEKITSVLETIKVYFDRLEVGMQENSNLEDTNLINEHKLLLKTIKENPLDSRTKSEIMIKKATSILEAIKLYFDHLKAGMQENPKLEGNNGQKNQINLINEHKKILIEKTTLFLESIKENPLDPRTNPKIMIEKVTSILETIKACFDRLEAIGVQENPKSESNNDQKNQINLMNEHKKILIEKTTLLLETIKENHLDSRTEPEIMKEKATSILEAIKACFDRLETGMQENPKLESNNGQKNQINLMNEHKKILIEKTTLLLETIKENQLDSRTKPEIIEKATSILEAIKACFDRLETGMQENPKSESNNGQKNQINLINEHRKKIFMEKATSPLETIKKIQIGSVTDVIKNDDPFPRRIYS